MNKIIGIVAVLSLVAGFIGKYLYDKKEEKNNHYKVMEW